MLFFSKAARQQSELEILISSSNKKIKAKGWKLNSVLKTINKLKMGKFKEHDQMIGGKLFTTRNLNLSYFNVGQNYYYIFQYGSSLSLKVVTDIDNNIIRIEDKTNAFKEESQDTIEFFIEEFKSILNIIDFKEKWRGKIRNALENHNSNELNKSKITEIEFSESAELTEEESAFVGKIEKIIPYINERKDELDFEDIHEFEKITYKKFTKIMRAYEEFTDEQKERNRKVLINTLESIFNQLNEFKSKIERKGENEFLKIAETLNDKSQNV